MHFSTEKCKVSNHCAKNSLTKTINLQYDITNYPMRGSIEA